MIFHQNALKTGFSAIKGQKGQIVENLLTTSFFGTKPFQLIKAELIFLSKIALLEKKLHQNSKAKAIGPPVTMKAGLQGQLFLLFSNQ